MARALFFWVIFMISVPFRVFGEFYSFRRSREFLGFCDSFRRSEEVGQNGAGDGLAFGRWDEYSRRTAACGGWMGSGAGRWDEYGELEWVAGDGWLDG